MDVGEVIVQISVQIGALTTIGSALIWVYKKLVSDPDKRMAEKIQQESAEALRNSIEPLTKSIDLLNHNLEESKEDRAKLNKKVNHHENIFNNHETRITVLEDWRREQ